MKLNGDQAVLQSKKVANKVGNMETMILEFSLFLGPVGGPELIIISVIILLLLSIPLAILFVIFVANPFSKKKPPALPPQPNPQEKLLALENICKENLITEAEYEEKRRAIFDNI
ncbi:MAG: hypothetical protein OSA84_01040 [Akkermansiaceae bacterium]|nr:hypothetical protein [Akkermansiaceae bacterium]